MTRKSMSLAVAVAAIVSLSGCGATTSNNANSNPSPAAPAARSNQSASPMAEDAANSAPSQASSQAAAGGSNADQASATESDGSSQSSEGDQNLPDAVSPAAVNIVHVPFHWVLPAYGKIQNLNETEKLTTYDLTKYSSDKLIAFYRANLGNVFFEKVSDQTKDGVTTLVYDSEDPNYRTTITTNAKGVHVEHRAK